MAGGNDVWARGVDGMMDHVGSSVEQTCLAAVDDLGAIADPDEVG